jgi:hypothetical protein
MTYDHSTNATKPNETAKAMPTAICIPPSTALIPDEELEPVVAELVDDDVAPDAVPDAEEEDVLELEVEKSALGSEETGLQVVPIIKKRRVSSF